MSDLHVRFGFDCGGGGGGGVRTCRVESVEEDPAHMDIYIGMGLYTVVHIL